MEINKKDLILEEHVEAIFAKLEIICEDIINGQVAKHDIPFEIGVWMKTYRNKRISQVKKDFLDNFFDQAFAEIWWEMDLGDTKIPPLSYCTQTLSAR